jgi:hypothetical protein
MADNYIKFSTPMFDACLTQTGPTSATLATQTINGSPTTYALDDITIAGDVISCDGPEGSQVTITLAPTSVHIVAKEAFWTIKDTAIPLTHAQYAAAIEFLTRFSAPAAV